MTGSIVRFALVAAAGALLMPMRVVAQAPGGAQIGDTVRVEAPARGPAIAGELAAVSGDTMYVRRYGATLAVPMSQVERIDVRRARPLGSRVVRGVAYGAVLGLAAGFVLGSAAQSGGEDCADDCNQAATIGAASGLGMGAALGLIIGVSSPMGRWVQVYSHRRVALGTVAEGRGVALSLDVKL